MNEILRDKIYACWLGKSIGGTLGTPVEGRKEFMSLTFYPRLGNEGALPNDDLDLQLVNLHAIEQHGILTDADAIASEWTEHVRFPWDEYGYAGTAMRLGLKPPYSGYYDNPFTNCMGCPIRSEIWAVVADGNPTLAAYFAWQDAVVDHAGGEGVYGEMFYAALETMALYSDGSDAKELVEKALACIPEVSRVYKAVNDTFKWFNEGVGYPEIRDRILAAHGNANFTDAPQNIAFSIVGLLYGSDFEDGMLKTVNLGYDTDCTVATLGSLYGLLYGTKFIPEKWSQPIGTKIVVSDAVIGCDAPADINELTDRSIAIIESFKPFDKSRFVISAEEALDIQRQKYILGGTDPAKNLVVTLRYADSVAIKPNSAKKITFELVNNSKGKMTLVPFFPAPKEAFSFDKDYNASPIVLEPGQKDTITLTMKFGERVPVIMQPVLLLNRLHDGQYWCQYKIPFTVLRAHKWIIDGKPVYFDGTHVDFTEKHDDGVYTAECTVNLPTERKTKLMAASVSPIKLELDGNVVVNEANRNDFMPAYHRCPWTECYTGVIAAGHHTIKITVTDETQIPNFIFAMLAPSDVSEPGNHYAYIDCTNVL